MMQCLWTVPRYSMIVWGGGKTDKHRIEQQWTESNKAGQGALKYRIL